LSFQILILLNTTMTTAPSQAPILSTPESHIFEDPTPLSTTLSLPRYTDTELWSIYEISRTAKEVRDGGYKRVALQFPDGMLRDAPRVFEALEQELKKLPPAPPRHEGSGETGKDAEEGLEKEINALSVEAQGLENERKDERRIRLYILADTSYGSCCVDEIAAEHVDADVVVHYGRSCLSPTARLPVIYVFTSRPLHIPDLVKTFEETFPEKDEKIILMADITYDLHIADVEKALLEKGYRNILVPEVIHDPSSIIPNRKVDESIEVKDYSLFHISDPPPALLLTLSSRVREMFIYPTTSPSTSPPSIIKANTALQLRRRYALLTSLSTCPIFGILINTLSVKNYLQTVTSLTSLISSAGKKSYTFVVGKVNAAKIANFSEIGGWVVVGCWESSLIESTEFYRPIITPFELGLALQNDTERLWSGEWSGDISSNSVLHVVKENTSPSAEDKGKDRRKEEHIEIGDEDGDSEEESAPPEFDLRTGRYVSHSRPMHTQPVSEQDQSGAGSKVLTRRAKGDLATVNGAVSPGAEYLRSQRTWTGLGSDFVEEEGSGGIEEGRSGVARGYRVGDGGERR
jgi:diphthamide biosynthesis protein 2